MEKVKYHSDMMGKQAKEKFFFFSFFFNVVYCCVYVVAMALYYLTKS